jgi:hypothetical protein
MALFVFYISLWIMSLTSLRSYPPEYRDSRQVIGHHTIGRSATSGREQVGTALALALAASQLSIPTGLSNTPQFCPA